jgi:hypothetical protein
MSITKMVMKPLIELLILGSIATSASAAGTEMHEIASEHAFQQQPSTLSRPMIGGDFNETERYCYMPLDAESRILQQVSPCDRSD